MLNLDKIKKIELIVFLTITILSLIPILSFNFFATLDGPAHLYNSQLLKNLVLKQNATLQQFFQINSIPIPNWMGHSILFFLQLFFSSYIAEKILLVLYVIGFAYSFRHLILTISPDNIFFSYLIFPFIFSFFLFLGFYNFLLSIILLFISISYWIKYERTGFTFKRSFILFLFFILTYFAHIFSFLWLLVTIGIYTGIQFLLDTTKEINFRDVLSANLKRVFILFCISIIPLIFSFIYFKSNLVFTNKTYLDKIELVDWLKNIRPIIALNKETEEAFTKKIFYLLCGLLSIALYNRINTLNFKGGMFREKLFSFIKSIINIKDVWFISSIILLYLYFKMPDSDGSAGFISIRLVFFFFIYLVTWLCVHPFPKWLGIFSATIILFCHFKLNQFYTQAEKQLNKVSVECYEASKKIQANSIILPLNQSGNWLMGHFSNYLGIDKPLVILENYEADNSYFPLQWNYNGIPPLKLADMNPNCINRRKQNSKTEPMQINYVFILGSMETNSDSCNNLIKQKLNSYFELIYSSDNCRLFKAK